jgi:hypothetical protein
MRHPDFSINDLIDALTGTCMSFEEAFNQLGMDDMGFEDLTSIDLETLDAMIFCCAECSWWCEQGDQRADSDGNEDFCSDCRPECE